MGAAFASGDAVLWVDKLSDVMRRPGRHLQSVADSSFDAWTKFYQQDEDAPNAIVSYYSKGSMVALALDLTLRLDGGTSLDEVIASGALAIDANADTNADAGVDTDVDTVRRVLGVFDLESLAGSS